MHNNTSTIDTATQNTTTAAIGDIVVHIPNTTPFYTNQDRVSSQQMVQREVARKALYSDIYHNIMDLEMDTNPPDVGVGDLILMQLFAGVISQALCASM